MKKILIILFILLMLTQPVNAQITVERNFSFADHGEGLYYSYASGGVEAPIYLDIMNFTFFGNTGSGLFIFTNIYDIMAGFNFKYGPGSNRVLIGRRYQKYFDDPITIFRAFSRVNINSDFNFTGIAEFTFYPDQHEADEELYEPNLPEGTISNFKFNIEYFITDGFYVNGGLHVLNSESFSPMLGLGGIIEF